jgi:hypothetical protein
VHFVWIIENVYNLGLLVLGGWIKILVPAVMVMGNPRNFWGKSSGLMFILLQLKGFDGA